MAHLNAFAEDHAIPISLRDFDPIKYMYDTYFIEKLPAIHLFFNNTYRRTIYSDTSDAIDIIQYYLNKKKHHCIQEL